MDTGREWTRRSIEELIEAKLKKIKIPTPTGGAQALFIVQGTGNGMSAGGSYDWHIDTDFLKTNIVNTGMQWDGGMVDGDTGTFPIIGANLNTANWGFLSQFRCSDLTDASINNGFTLLPIYGAVELTRYKWAWAYNSSGSTRTLYALHYNGDYEVCVHDNIQAPFRQRSSTSFSINGQSTYAFYGEIESGSKANMKSFRNKVANKSGDSYERVIMSNLNLDIDSIKAYIEYRWGYTITATGDLDLS